MLRITFFPTFSFPKLYAACGVYVCFVLFFMKLLYNRKHFVFLMGVCNHRVLSLDNFYLKLSCFYCRLYEACNYVHIDFSSFFRLSFILFGFISLRVVSLLFYALAIQFFINTHTHWEGGRERERVKLSSDYMYFKTTTTAAVAKSTNACHNKNVNHFPFYEENCHENSTTSFSLGVIISVALCYNNKPHDSK